MNHSKPHLLFVTNPNQKQAWGSQSNDQDMDTNEVSKDLQSDYLFLLEWDDTPAQTDQKQTFTHPQIPSLQVWKWHWTLTENTQDAYLNSVHTPHCPKYYHHKDLNNFSHHCPLWLLLQSGFSSSWSLRKEQLPTPASLATHCGTELFNCRSKPQVQHYFLHLTFILTLWFKARSKNKSVKFI